MYSGGNTRALPRVGFPIRKSRDQRLVSISPGLIAAAHVLHRLLAPRHPPCALILLIRKNTFVLSLWSFQGARRPARPTHRRDNRAHRLSTACRLATAQHGLSKLSSVRKTCVEVDVASRRIESSDGLPKEDIYLRSLPEQTDATSSTPIGVSAPISLERR